MNISNLTTGQQQALFVSLSNQTSKMTQSEKDVLEELTTMFSEKLTGEASGYERVGNKVRMINMDTFGDRYNNCWLKIYTSNKGEFFTHSYTGNKRVYLD